MSDCGSVPRVASLCCETEAAGVGYALYLSCCLTGGCGVTVHSGKPPHLPACLSHCACLFYARMDGCLGCNLSLVACVWLCEIFGASVSLFFLFFFCEWSYLWLVFSIRGWCKCLCWRLSFVQTKHQIQLCSCVYMLHLTSRPDVCWQGMQRYVVFVGCALCFSKWVILVLPLDVLNKTIPEELVVHYIQWPL